MLVRVGILTAPKIEYEQRKHTFVLRNVRIGIGFHWDRHEDQEFEGELQILHNPDGTETAVNIIDIEDYLTSVISSEMSASSPIELLKAHTIIARSWLLRAIGHTDHIGYDVCADDHCQRYEGIRRRNERAIEAVHQTRGEVLTYDGKICDTRYHKCCGGKTELFENCWEETEPHPYLESIADPFCDTRDRAVLQQVLNDYDLETMDFHDWQVTYTQTELSAIVKQKSGIDFGIITNLIPIKRGPSGRIYELQIVGTNRTKTISKELKIRNWLSHSHLYSSAFSVEKHEREIRNQKSEIQEKSEMLFTLTGKGWGHGVGLCQIGAAVMASQGYDYRQILSHYFPKARISVL